MKVPRIYLGFQFELFQSYENRLISVVKLFLHSTAFLTSSSPLDVSGLVKRFSELILLSDVL
jgi:hypothetical protein